MLPYSTDSKEVLASYGVTESSGLSPSQLEANLDKYGANVIENKGEKSPLKILFDQINNTLTYVLIIATFLSFMFDHLLDGYIVMSLIILNISIGFYLEFSAERRLKGLSKLMPRKCKVLRDGSEQIIDTTELVPGDIVVLEDGQIIPADIRLISVSNLSTIEASLTGEAAPIQKNIGILPVEAPLGDRTNMLYMGTYIVTGECIGVVTAISTATELGKISVSLNEMTTEKSLFHHRTENLMKIMIFTSVFTSLLSIIVLSIKGSSIEEIAQFSIATLIAGIPEGLPSVLTILLSIAAFRMARKKALMRNIPSIETLSSVNTIVTDKTGTLTQNVMSIGEILLTSGATISIENRTYVAGDFTNNGEKIIPTEDSLLTTILSFLAITSSCDIIDTDGEIELNGYPTELARYALSYKAGITKDVAFMNYRIVDTSPYDQETKFKSLIIEHIKTQEKFHIIVGGAEKVLENVIDKDFAVSYVEESALEGYRMQTLAYKTTTADLVSESKIGDFTHLATLRISDPLHEDVPEAIMLAKRAGIRIIMATGDHASTAFAIAKQAGVIDFNPAKPELENYVVTQIDIDKMSEEDFRDAVLSKNVFARVSPITKLRIAEVLQSDGQIVAMTGDGVNDAPVLKKADIGIAMGMNGTDVARESSDIILLDDNFSTIIDAIKEGRTVFANIRRTSLYLIATNFAESLIILVVLLMGLPLPLLPIQILWLNLVTDGVNDVALATEKAHSDVLNDKPISRDTNILTKRDLPLIASVSFFMASIAVLIFYLNYDTDLTRARSLAFSFMVLAQLFNVVNMRSFSQPVWRIGYFSNKSVNVSILVSFIAFICVMTVPSFSAILGFSRLSVVDLLLTAFGASLILVFGEIYRWYRSREKEKSAIGGVATK